MSNKNYLQITGWGSILAGLIWAVLVFTGIANQDIFIGNFLDYLGMLAPLLVLIAAVALYLQGSHNILGPAILSLGSAGFAISVFLYNIAFDPENGLAFTLYFFGLIIQGLGMTVVGKGFRSRHQTTGIGTILVILGIVMILAFPASFVIQDLLGLNIERFGDLIWGGIMLVVAISWIILGWGVYLGTVENELEVPGLKDAKQT